MSLIFLAFPVEAGVQDRCPQVSTCKGSGHRSIRKIEKNGVILAMTHAVSHVDANQMGAAETALSE
jgi:hypothetical protein